MTLYMIGLGLNDEKDISIKGLEAIKKCNHIFLENYTSGLNVTLDKLEKFYCKKIIPTNRELVENNAEEILTGAVYDDVAFLVVGDVFSATTHADLFLRAKEKKIVVKVIHNTSIMTAIGVVGLELYKYGKTTSMPFFEKSFKPQTPYDVIKMNLKNGLHTLVLLDIKKEQKRYMTINQAITQILVIEKERKQKVLTQNTKVIGCARIGTESQMIKYGTVSELLNYDFGDPLHCLIIPGKLHFIEDEMLKLWG
jgi:diphthine synthase